MLSADILEKTACIKSFLTSSSMMKCSIVDKLFIEVYDLSIVTLTIYGATRSKVVVSFV